ncbi:MAG: hypothetical protein ACI9WU_004642, partial [Myxococcota bacterium]
MHVRDSKSWEPPLNKRPTRNVVRSVGRYLPVMIVLFGCLGSGLLSGCATRAPLIRGENEVYVEGLVSIWGSWVKDKGDKFDVSLSIQNRGRRGIFVRRRDLLCARGDRWGELSVLRGGDRRRIRLRPGQTARLTVVCRLANARIRGDYRIILGHVFEEPRRRRRRRAKPPVLMA